uniref:Ig-like domain-containing protein n=1 Tax=Scleropages formosus TaxID=113540 RepID=A0A8C9TZV0_SCLFO
LTVILSLYHHCCVRRNKNIFLPCGGIYHLHNKSPCNKLCFSTYALKEPPELFHDETENIYWYKLIIGQKPQLIASSHKYSEPFFFIFNSTRFKIKKDVGINHLIISETETSDTAMYYCGVRRDFGTVFGAGVFLTINEGGQSNSKTVVQQPVSDPVRPGDSVTLQCTVDSETCAGEHSVYWFRHGSGESLPGLIYTHGNRRDECEKSPEAGSPTHGCVYSLPKRNLSRSDAGIYYCAVATCGDILFGNGTQLEIKAIFMLRSYIQNYFSDSTLFNHVDFSKCVIMYFIVLPFCTLFL